MKIQPVHALVGAAIVVVSSLLSLALSARAPQAQTDDVARRRAIIMAAIAADAASATTVPVQQGQGQLLPIAFAPASVVETRNAVQTRGVNVPQDALCRSRPDPATFSQCCLQKMNAGVLDRTCPVSNLSNKQIGSFR
jgi:hypothetical protein